MTNPFKSGERVKQTICKLHDAGMPYITNYGTVIKPYDEFVKILWDDGHETFTYAEGRGIMPIDTKLRYPEPLAYRKPNSWQELWSDKPWEEAA